MIVSPYVPPLDALPWIFWILSYGRYWEYFVTFTFPYKRVDNHYASRKTREIIRRINVHVFGRHYRQNRLGLLMVCCLQDLRVNPHVHLLVENNSRLNEAILTQIWLDSLGSRASSKAVDVQPITDLVTLAGYVTRKVDKHKVETLPIPNIPPKHQLIQGGGNEQH
jgi:hypothetical protein